MKRKIKVMGVTVIPLILLAVVSLVGIINLKTILIEMKNISEKDIPLTSILGSITEHQLEQAIWFERALRYGGTGSVDKLGIAVESFARLSDLVEEEIEKGKQIAKEASENAGSAATRREFDEILTHLSIIEEEHAEYELHVEQVFTLLSRGESASLNISVDKIEQEEEDLYRALRKLETRIEQFTLESMQMAVEREKSAIRLMVIGLGIFVIIGLIVFPLLLLFW